MGSNLCDINHLDADLLLPPRKRLLAGLKKQNFGGGSHFSLTSSISSEFDTQLDNLLKSHLDKSPEEIVKVSRLTIEAAVEVAKTARAAAESKAVVAAKAMAAAKSALDFVANMSDNTFSRENLSRNNEVKRHNQVRMLYDKKQRVGTDEELVHNLHGVFPRNTKNSPVSDLKSHMYKRLIKSVPSSKKLKFHNGDGTCKGYPTSVDDGVSPPGELDFESSTKRAHVTRIEDKTSKLGKGEQLQIDDVEAASSHLKQKMLESLKDSSSFGRKRGRIKQKKLLLSVCNFRDQENPINS